MTQVPRLESTSTARRALSGVLLGLGVTLLLSLLRGSSGFERVEGSFLDARTRMFVGQRAPDPRIVLAVVDEIEAETHEDEPRERIVTDDWAWRHHTDGRSAVIVGGDPRPERVARLQEEFGFASLEWIDNASGAGKRLDSLLERMRHGTVDMVIMMRAFSSHTLTDATFGLKDRACDLVLADTYGVTQVRLAIERFLDPA